MCYDIGQSSAKFSSKIIFDTLCNNLVDLGIRKAWNRQRQLGWTPSQREQPTPTPFYIRYLFADGSDKYSNLPSVVTNYLDHSGRREPVWGQRKFELVWPHRAIGKGQTAGIVDLLIFFIPNSKSSSMYVQFCPKQTRRLPSFRLHRKWWPSVHS